ncbi:MAG: flavodoxin family protein [Pseudomonadota bacterium]
MTQLLAVNGSYREGGTIDQVIEVAVQTALVAGVTIEVIHLRDFPIEFCRNCRHCTQVPGEAPGECVHQDGMRELIDKIEAADGYILASPTNFYSVTALFKRFMERLVVYAYWPWGSHAPKFRKKKATKMAILIASSAAPGLMGRLFYATLKQLKMTAKTIGAKPVASMFVGLMSQQEHPALPEKVRQRIQTMVRKLM